MMNDTSKTTLRSWRELILCALLIVSGSGAVLAGQGENYIGVYNDLAEMIADRCMAVGETTRAQDLTAKDVTSTNAAENSVTQVDLEFLRSSVLYLAENHYIVPTNMLTDTLTNGAVADAFPYALRWGTNNVAVNPSVMEAVGDGDGQFTAVPSEYTSGSPVYTNTFTNVPVLWVHFQEIYDVACPSGKGG